MANSKITTFIKSYWNYYLDLEKEFEKTQKYVAFDLYNKNTYSLEFLKLFQAVCSEIDVVAKAIAIDLEPNLKNEKTINIQKWGYVLQQKMPKLSSSKVLFNDDFYVSPWKNWRYTKKKNKNGIFYYPLEEGTKTPSWWLAYNSVKHARTDLDNPNGHINYTKANLDNLIQSYAALLILEWLYIEVLDGTPEVEIGYSALYNTYEMDIE